MEGVNGEMGWGKNRNRVKPEAALTAVKNPMFQNRDQSGASRFGVRRVGKAAKIVKRKIPWVFSQI